MMYVLSGLSGVGKTGVALTIAGRTGAEILRTDEIRLEALDMPYDALTSNDGIAAVYIEMLRRAEKIVLDGKPVILDATFLYDSYRQMVREMAARLGEPLTFIEVRCPAEIAKQRILDRKGDASRVTIAARERQEKQWEPISDPHVVIRTDQTRAEVAKDVETLLGLPTDSQKG